MRSTDGMEAATKMFHPRSVQRLSRQLTSLTRLFFSAYLQRLCYSRCTYGIATVVAKETAGVVDDVTAAAGALSLLSNALGIDGRTTSA